MPVALIGWRFGDVRLWFEWDLNVDWRAGMFKFAWIIGTANCVGLGDVLMIFHHLIITDDDKGRFQFWLPCRCARLLQLQSLIQHANYDEIHVFFWRDWDFNFDWFAQRESLIGRADDWATFMLVKFAFGVIEVSILIGLHATARAFDAGCRDALLSTWIIN